MNFELGELGLFHLNLKRLMSLFAYQPIMFAVNKHSRHVKSPILLLDGSGGVERSFRKKRVDIVVWQKKEERHL